MLIATALSLLLVERSWKYSILKINHDWTLMLQTFDTFKLHLNLFPVTQKILVPNINIINYVLYPAVNMQLFLF